VKNEMIAVIFDMDGVLVDVSMSYIAAIQKTAQYFLDETITRSEIEEYRNRGGLNNDWDLTAHILNERGKPVDKKLLIDVFQSFYLGHEFNGLIQNEQWLLQKDIIDRLHASYPMGIVTGRPKIEAHYVLKRFKVEECFSVLITMDDIPPDKKKPDPFGIELALQRFPAESAIYIGDTVDDMVAAKRAGVIPIGVISPGNDKDSQREALIQNGACYILRDVSDILEVLA